MADIFVGDNDHGDAVPPTDVLFQALHKHNESVAKSYEKIATKYHATLEKLAQDENANEN
jgi:hypothetical protein